jgi:serine/threonine protein kinase
MRFCPKCKKKFPDSISFCPLDGTTLLGEDQAPREFRQERRRLENKVLGSYRLEEVLAEGGMGIIFLAKHVKLGRQVALKMLRPQFSDNKKAVTRFFREARAVNEIEHENIIEITDFIEDDHGDNYYIMELLEGQDLRKLIMKEGPLSVPRSLGIAIQVSNALAAVHQAGIVHRDLKSENVFLVKRGDNPDFVKLLDFGVAKLIRHTDEEDIHKTIEGTILGTAEYMSPEQASGKPVDFRTDIYSLGVILYEMLTGRRPITGKSFSEIIYNQLTVTPLRPSQIKDLSLNMPVHMEELIMQCLEKDPELRPQSMEEMEARLRNIGREGSVQCETASREFPAVQKSSRKALWAVVVVLVAGLGAGAFFLFPWDQAHSEVKPQDQPPPVADVKDPPVPEPPPTRQPETVQVLFESTPQGAQIFTKEGDGPLGTTPATLTLSRADEVRIFELRLKGYKPARRRVSMAQDSNLNVPLLKGKPVGMKKKKKKKKKKKGTTDIDMGGTVDPFEE